MKDAIKHALQRAGIYYAKRQYMPVGIDWLWDIERIVRGRPVQTVFDVGANIGQTTQVIKARFPAAAVHAFEPVSSTYQTLERNVRPFHGVTCHRLALSDRPGMAAMTADANSPLNRLVEARPNPGSVEQVETDTLDRFCLAHRVERIDILKVDAEGADLKVLQGAGRMLREGRVSFVFAEVGFDPADAGHVHVSALLDHLRQAGVEPYSFYDYCRLRPPAYEDEGLGLVFANVLLVSPAGLTAPR